MSDGYVGLYGDGSGKKVDVSELTRADATVVERQRIVIGDNVDPLALAPASVRGLLVEMQEAREIQLQILATMRVVAMQLALISGVHLTDEPLATFN